VLAVDRLADLGGTLASLTPETMHRLDAVLPPIWSRSNPVDIVGDADAARYAAAFEILLEDMGSDAILVMNVTTALASATDASQAIVAAARKRASTVLRPKPAFAVWIGQDGTAEKAFDSAAIPHFENESDAVGGFMHLVRYREAIDALMETPPSLPADFSPNVEGARSIVQRVIERQRTWLDPLEAAELLEAYSISITPVLLARDADEAAQAAAPLLARGDAVVVKILSPDVVHKSEVGGVRLNLTSETAVRQAAADILARARSLKPQARLAGVTIHPMIVRPKARELIAGIADDPTFGPIVVFGQGGTAVEVINDKALALPPLDLGHARQLIGRTRVSRILKELVPINASAVPEHIRFANLQPTR
jgi:acetyltransferase